MARKGFSRSDVAVAVGVKTRTVTNWTSGETMPTAVQREVLRRALGAYDSTGDPVEIAVRSSGLIKWRQDAVMTEYERHRHEQGREERSG